MEASLHLHSSFVTLTYRPENLSYIVQSRLATLIPDDSKNWLKRLRKAIEPRKLRYYIAGEYGDVHERPHYHAVLFGYKGCSYGVSRYRDGRTLDCCASCDLIRDTWDRGIIECQPLTAKHAAYVCGYVMKKMTNKADDRLHGRYPEFARMSLKPGIGGDYAPAIAAAIPDAHLEKMEDVPTAIRMGGKLMPIGRYIRRRIRIELGGDGTAPEAIIRKMEEEMLPLLQAAKTDPENLTLKKQIIARCRGEVASMKAKAEIFKTRNRNRTL